MAADQLPVHSSSDIHLADAFAQPGCPLCREERRTEGAFLEAILAESVNDVAFRGALDAARGFCAPHSRAVLETDRRRSGSLGAAILLRATLRIRLSELEAAHAAAGRSRSRRVEDATRPPACPVCGRMARAEDGLLDGLMRLTDEAPWAGAVSRAPLCLRHLLGLMRQKPPSAGWPAIEDRQLDRLRSLGEDLAAYAHASSHDRRHLLTDAHRASVDASADVLAGPAAVPLRGGRQDAAPDAARDAAGAVAVLVTGPYGAGKTSVAIELVDRFATDGNAVAAIDLDWLGWYGPDLGFDEHEDPRITLANLRALRDVYLAAGIRRFVLAYALRSATQLASVRQAMGMPITVIRLDVPIIEIRRRLAGDPNASRAEDLATAERWLADGVGTGLEDRVISGDRDVGAVADEIAGILGWPEVSA